MIVMRVPKYQGHDFQVAAEYLKIFLGKEEMILPGDRLSCHL
tara:strand:+ start:272 stop:397 length:126 start_codon:yes stop_codon:yes gene_type:complete